MGKFKSYPDYAPAGWAWLDSFPAHWKSSRVKYDSYVKARVGWHGLTSDEFTDEGPYLITGTDFLDGKIHWGDCKHCTQERYNQDPYIQLKEGDLLITKDGTIGKLALVRGMPGAASLNSGVFVVRPQENIYLPKFYFWLLSSPVFSEFIDYQKTGSTISHLYQDTFVNFGYPLPSKDEQHQIVAFLDHETSNIDRLIARQERLIELLKEKRQAVISHAVTKGVNPNAPMKDSGVEWLGEVPAHWKVSRLKRLTSLVGGFAFSSDDFLEDGIQLLRIGNVYLNRLSLERQPVFLPPEFLVSHCDFTVKKGDIIISLTGTLGKRDYGYAVSVDDEGPFLLNQRVGKLCPFNEKAEPEFLLRLLYSESYLAQLYSLPFGTKQANLGNDDVLNVIVAYPLDMNEQMQIVKWIDAKLYKLDKLMNKCLEAIELMKEHRTALISAAVTGKIDVRNWRKPNTESQETAVAVSA